MSIGIGGKHLSANIVFDEAQRLSRRCVVCIHHCRGKVIMNYIMLLNIVLKSIAMRNRGLHFCKRNACINSQRRGPYGPCRLLQNPICDSSMVASNCFVCAGSGSLFSECSIFFSRFGAHSFVDRALLASRRVSRKFDYYMTLDVTVNLYCCDVCHCSICSETISV